MFDFKDAEIQDEEAEMILQNRKQSGYIMTSLPVLQNRFRFLIFYFHIF